MYPSNSMLVLCLLLLAPMLALGQYAEVAPNYYTFPIRPNESNSLSGNMGELRSNHFHAGIDIKTSGREGIPVYAAADGYVSRIRIGTGSYGNALYIQHPNGTSTVYAHLQKFNPLLAQYSLKAQYENKSFSVNLFPKRNELPVERGQVIAYSGNSGSSSGPHLHFEIRGASQEILDPLRLGFSEIKDNISPDIFRFALKTMRIDSRVNEQFGRFEYIVPQGNSSIHYPDTLLVYGTIGLELYTFDRLNGAPNRNGVPFIDVFVDDRLYFQQSIDSLLFSQQKNILIHSNYQAQIETGRRYHKLYVEESNPLNIYPVQQQNGLLKMDVGDIVPIKIIATDAYGNSSQLNLVLKGVTPKTKIIGDVQQQKGDYLLDNTLMVFREKINENDLLTIYQQKGSRVIQPNYSNDQTHVYLIDLRSALVKAVVDVHGKQKVFDFLDRIPPNRSHTFLSDSYGLSFDKNTLFDTVYLRAKHEVDTVSGRDIFDLPNPIYPLKKAISVDFIRKGTYDSLGGYHVYSYDNPSYPSYVGGVINNDKVSFSAYGMGKFTLLRDSIPPVIQLQGVQKDIIRLRILDDLSGIDNFEAQLDGKWLLMHYEPKRNLIWSERLNKNKALKGEFELKVTDKAGNESILQLNLD